MKMNSVCDVSKVLANRSKLADSTGISVKANMSEAERKVESILLKVRRGLINSGTERKSIKIRSNSLYVSNMKHGSVKDLKYVPCNSEAETAPLIPSLNDQNYESPGATEPSSAAPPEQSS